MCVVYVLSAVWFGSCVDLYPSPQSGYWKVLTSYGALMLPFKNHTHLWTATLPPSPSQHLVCSLLLKFCHFKMLHKWDHVIHNILGLTLFTHLKVFPSPGSQWLLLFYCQVVFHGRGVPRFVHPLKDIWADLSLWWSWVKPAMNICVHIFLWI